MYKIVIIGAGPAGMMAAIRASQFCQDVAILEKNGSAGKKLLLSGKGRCNLTNTCGLEDFLKRFYDNGQFLRDAFKGFFNKDLMGFFEKRGLKLKTERQFRVFPESDSSLSVLKVLLKELGSNKVKLIYDVRVKNIAIEEGRVKGVFLEDKSFIPAESVILATGGLSYSFTGSTGDGIRIAKNSGHRIIPCRPGLVALEVVKGDLALPEGLTLKNIRIRFSNNKKTIDSEIGELLFTDFGISGPLVLSLSGLVADMLADKEKVSAWIDLKPALSEEQLHNRLLREIKTNPRRNIGNLLKNLLPVSLIGVFLDGIHLKRDKKANQITAEERQRTVFSLKNFHLDIKCSRPMEEAMITRGGVSLKDIDPKTMQSRLVKRLYFCGEMVDVAADTGGFNLQAAFSTGYLAGESAAKSL